MGLHFTGLVFSILMTLQLRRDLERRHGASKLIVTLRRNRHFPAGQEVFPLDASGLPAPECGLRTESHRRSSLSDKEAIFSVSNNRNARRYFNNPKLSFFVSRRDGQDIHFPCNAGVTGHHHYTHTTNLQQQIADVHQHAHLSVPRRARRMPLR